MPSAVEMCIVLAVRQLCGDAAAAAFVTHCDEIERTLQELDTVRH